jgi:ABC-type transport system substrate-binding protein
MAWFGGGKKKAAEKKVLRVGMLAALHEIDPRKTQDLGTVFVLTQIFEPPYALPPDDTKPAEPLLFTGPLQESDRGNTLTGTVRPGLKFSDGTPLTAAHVAGSLTRTEVLARAATVEAQGDRVIFRLRRPNKRFDVVLAQSYSAVVLEKDGKLLGTGPFMAASGGPDGLCLAKNPHYREPVALDEIDFKVFPSADALAAAVEAGQVDFTGSLSRDDVGKIREARKLFPPGASTAILYFNTERPYLGLTDVRKALALAVDRLEVTRTSYANALAFAASSLLPPMMGSFRDGLSPNLERAKELLAPRRGELPPRLRLVLVWGPRPYLPQPKTAATVIARQLGELGVGVEVVATTNVEDYNRKVRSGDYDLLLTGWIADTLDPADYLDANLHSELVPTLESAPVNRANRSRWKSRQMDAALARYREQRSEEARAEVMRLISDEVPLLPLMYGPTVVVHSWRVKNFEPSPLGLPNLASVDLEG